ncbi:ATP-grasp domain-containing protein [Nonomuraea sp. NPDC046570]|uniref:ATP-grasp domain-containing protein n=1 Tax=Nonomuraea sp. NPDC046570 TaxID=3155255 RepID=UPI0033C18A6A
MPRVAVIAGRAHAVRYAHELGVDVVLVHEPDMYEDFFAARCERVVHASTTDTSAILEVLAPLHRERPFDRVLSTTDLGTVPAAEVAEALGIPGNPAEAARILKDKARVREVLAEHGLDPVAFARVTGAEELIEFAASITGPVVAKPIDASGSVGVHVIHSRQDAELAWKALREAGHTQAVAEEFLDGPLVTVEAFSAAGRHVTLGVTEETINDFYVETGITAPSRVPGDYDAEIRRLTTDLLDAIGIVEGPSHTEFVVTPRGPRILESHCRMAGVGIPEMIRRAYGVDENLLFLGGSLGLVDLPERAPEPVGGAAIRFFTPPEGRIVSVDGLDELDPAITRIRRVRPDERLYGFPGLFEELTEAEVGVCVPLNPGDSTTAVRTGWDLRNGFVIASGADADEAVARCEHVLSTVRFTLA